MISRAITPSGWGLKIVLRGVPELTSQTTSIESSPVSAVTIISRFLLYAVAEIWLHLINEWVRDLAVVFADYFRNHRWHLGWQLGWRSPFSLYW